jgi:hypothetical protein
MRRVFCVCGIERVGNVNHCHHMQNSETEIHKKRTRDLLENGHHNKCTRVNARMIRNLYAATVPCPIPLHLAKIVA